MIGLKPFEAALARAYITQRISKDELGCWIWTKYLPKSGYPWGSVASKRMKANRLSYLAFTGPINEGLCVCHKCDRPSCVNPDHLFLGTTQENTADRVSKNRSARGEMNGARTCPERIPRGESNPASRHTEATVLEIRSLYASGDSIPSISRRLSIHRQTVRNIVTRISWSHLP